VRAPALMLIVLLAGIGCAGKSSTTTSTTAAASASPSAEASVAALASPAAPSPGMTTTVAMSGGSTPAPVPTDTPDPNLLSSQNGTLLRSYSPGALDRMNDGNLGNAALGIGAELPDDAKPPFVFTFELPGVATIDQFEADMRPKNKDTDPYPTVSFATSTTSATDGFTDAGTVTAGDSAYKKTLAFGKTARWVRVTSSQLFERVAATGTLAPPPHPLDPTGVYIEESRPYKNGAFSSVGTNENDARARFVAVGPSLTMTECVKDDVTGVFVGRFAGREWYATFTGNRSENAAKIRAVMNDEGTVIAGFYPGGSTSDYFMRTTEKPAFCEPRVNGTGTHHVLVLDQDPIIAYYPSDAQPALPGYTFEAIGAGMLDASMLAGKEAVLTRGVCKLPELTSPEQRALLLQWVAAGHKLILGASGCNTGADFTWLPYPFQAADPGPETDNASMIQVENDALGSNDKNDTTHYLDIGGYVLHQNDLGSSNAMATKDPHWCGHLFVAKPTNVNGFVQSYAVDGGGELIYDGMNVAAQPTPQRARVLEVQLSVPAALPCSQSVTSSFVLEPSQEAAFVSGKAQAIRVDMRLLANQGWSGHATLKASGDIPATVTPNAFDIAGGTQNVSVSVRVPASQKPGVYTVNVVADNGSGKTAQASVTLTGTAPPQAAKKQLATQKRIRIYGIHFDVDSAHIQPRSESVIAEIADTMTSTPSLRFQVEGHTDSDGGAAYNLGLSQRRAQAVVDDLVARHHIARGRLVAKGFGLTKPVAPNTTPAGKALNRRVELLRL